MNGDRETILSRLRGSGQQGPGAPTYQGPVSDRELILERLRRTGGAPQQPEEAFMSSLINEMLLGIPEATGAIRHRPKEGLLTKGMGAVGSLAGFLSTPLYIGARVGPRLLRAGVTETGAVVGRGALGRPLSAIVNKLPRVGERLAHLGPKAQYRLVRMVNEASVLGAASVAGSAGPYVKGDVPLVATYIQGALMGLAFGSSGSIKSVWKRIPVMAGVTSIPTYLSTGDIEEAIVQAGLGVYFGVRSRGMPREIERAQVRTNLYKKFVEADVDEAGAIDAARSMELGLFHFIARRSAKRSETKTPEWLKEQEDAFFESLEALENSGMPLLLEAPETGFTVPARGAEFRTRGGVAAEGREPPLAEAPPTRIDELQLRIENLNARIAGMDDYQARVHLGAKRTELENELRSLESEQREDIEAFMPGAGRVPPERQLPERLPHELEPYRGEVALPPESAIEQLTRLHIERENVIEVADSYQAANFGVELGRMGYKEVGEIKKTPIRKLEGASLEELEMQALDMQDVNLQLKMGQLRSRGLEPKALLLPDGTYRIFTRETPEREAAGAEAREAGAETARELETEARRGEVEKGVEEQVGEAEAPFELVGVHGGKRLGTEYVYPPEAREILEGLGAAEETVAVIATRAGKKGMKGRRKYEEAAKIIQEDMESIPVIEGFPRFDNHQVASVKEGFTVINARTGEIEVKHAFGELEKAEEWARALAVKDALPEPTELPPEAGEIVPQVRPRSPSEERAPEGIEEVPPEAIEAQEANKVVAGSEAAALAWLESLGPQRPEIKRDRVIDELGVEEVSRLQARGEKLLEDLRPAIDVEAQRIWETLREQRDELLSDPAVDAALEAGGVRPNIKLGQKPTWETDYFGSQGGAYSIPRRFWAKNLKSGLPLDEVVDMWNSRTGGGKSESDFVAQLRAVYDKLPEIPFNWHMMRDEALYSLADRGDPRAKVVVITREGLDFAMEPERLAAVPILEAEISRRLDEAAPREEPWATEPAPGAFEERLEIDPSMRRAAILGDHMTAKVYKELNLLPAEEAIPIYEANKRAEYIVDELGLDAFVLTTPEQAEWGIVGVRFGTGDPISETRVGKTIEINETVDWVRQQQARAIDVMRRRYREEGFSELQARTTRDWSIFLKDLKEGKYEDFDLVYVPYFENKVEMRVFNRSRDGHKRQSIKVEVKPTIQRYGEAIRESRETPLEPDIDAVGVEGGLMKWGHDEQGSNATYLERRPSEFGRFAETLEPLEASEIAGKAYDSPAFLDGAGRLWERVDTGRGNDLEYKPYRAGAWNRGPFLEHRGYREINPGSEEAQRFEFIKVEDWNANKKAFREQDQVKEDNDFQGVPAAGDLHPQRSPLNRALGRISRMFTREDATEPIMEHVLVERDAEGLESFIVSDGEKVFILRGTELLPENVNSALLDTRAMRVARDYRFFEEAEAVGPGVYPEWRDFYPALESPAYRQVPVKETLKALEGAELDFKGESIEVLPPERMAYMIVKSLENFGAPGEEMVVWKNGRYVRQSDLHDSEWRVFDAHLIRDSFRALEELGVAEVDMILTGDISDPFVLSGQTPEGKPVDILVGTYRRPESVVPGGMPEAAGKRQKHDRILSDIGQVSRKMGEIRDKLEFVETDAEQENLLARMAELDNRMGTLSEEAKKVGLHGLPRVTPSVGAARKASWPQHRMARYFMKKLGMGEKRYQELKLSLTGKKHMMADEDRGLPGMMQEEAQRVIDALAHMAVEREVREAHEVLDMAQKPDEILAALSIRDGEAPDPVDAGAVGLFAKLRPARHPMEANEKPFKARSMIFDPLHDCSLAWKKVFEKEVLSALEKVGRPVVRNKDAMARTTDVLEIGLDEGNYTFQKRLRDATAEDISAIAKEIGETEDIVRAAQHYRKRYDWAYHLGKRHGLDWGYVYAYSPRIAKVSVIPDLLNLAYPDGIPREIYVRAMNERVGELENAERNAHVLFEEYMRQLYRRIYMQKPIEDARWHLHNMAVGTEAVEMLVKEARSKGQAQVVAGKAVFTDESGITPGILFAQEQYKNLRSLRRFTEDYIERLMGWPSKSDQALANSMRSFAKASGLDKLMLKAGIDLHRDRFVMQLATLMTNFGYMGGLGFRYVSVMVNLLQANNTIADIGPQWWMKGVMELGKKHYLPSGEEVTSFKYLREMGVLREFLPEYYREITGKSGTMKHLQELSMAAFKWSDRFNRAGAYFGQLLKFNYYLGQWRNGDITYEQFWKNSGAKGQPESVRNNLRRLLRHSEKAQDFEAAHVIASETTGRTQYWYNQEDAPLITRSAIGKVMWQYQTWPWNYGEMFVQWGKEGQWQKFARWAASSALMWALLDEAAKQGFDRIKPEQRLFFGPFPSRKTEYDHYAPPLSPGIQLALDAALGPVALGQELISGDKKERELALRDFVNRGARDLQIFIPGHALFQDVSPYLAGQRTSFSREITRAIFPPEEKKKRGLLPGRSRSRGGR